MSAWPIYIAVNGDRQRDPRPADDASTAFDRRRDDPLAGGSDRSWDRSRPPFLRGQESRLLGPAVDRLERLFLPPHDLRLCEQQGLDVRRPYVAANRDRLFAHLA